MYDILEINGKKYFKKSLKIISQRNIDLLKNEIEKNLMFSEFPFVLKVYQYDIEKKYYVIYDYVEGISLDQKKFYYRENLFQFLVNLCDIINVLHNNNIVHCDLKPQNILISNTEQIYLIDWELSTFCGDKVTFGTLNYCSLDQLYHNPVSIQFDIYSIGMIFYEFLTNEKPFSKLSFNEIVAKKSSFNLLFSSFFVDSPRILDQVLYKSLHSKYHSIHELQLDLKKLM